MSINSSQFTTFTYKDNKLDLEKIYIKINLALK